MAAVLHHDAPAQERTAWVEVEVGVVGVVDEAAHAVAAGVADPAARGGGRRRRLGEERERADLEHVVLQGGRRERAARAQVEVADVAPPHR